MEAVKSNPPALEGDEAAPPSYFDIIESAPPPPTHSIIIPNHDNEELVRQITSQGISDEWARIALRRCSGNVNEAIRLCIESGALDSPSQPTRPTTKKKKGNVVTRTLGAFKRSSDKSERSNIHEDPPPSTRLREERSNMQNKIPPISSHRRTEEHPEPPPSYDHVIINAPPIPPPELFPPNDLSDLPSYEDIIGPAPHLPSLANVDSLEPKFPVTPENPVSSLSSFCQTLETPVSIPPMEQSGIKNSDHIKNSDSIPPMEQSVGDDSSPPEEPHSKVFIPPLLLSQTQNKSWKGWTRSGSSGEISPIYVPLSGDYTSDYSDVVVEDMRKPSHEADGTQTSTRLAQESENQQEIENSILQTTIQGQPQPSERLVLETNSSISVSTNHQRGMSDRSIDNLMNKEEEISQTDQNARLSISLTRQSARLDEPVDNLVTLIDENTEDNLPSIIPCVETSRNETTTSLVQGNLTESLHNPEVNIDEVSFDTPVERNSLSSLDALSNTQDVVESPHNILSLPSSTHAVETSSTHVLPSFPSSQSIGSAQMELPSQVLPDNHVPLSLSARPISMSRLPRATSVAEDAMDDDTIHGEAYVQVSLNSGAIGTAVADLYVRDESGGLYVAVAAPLSTTEDDNPTPSHAIGVPVSSDEHNSNQNRGIISYARNRLYGEQGSPRREIEGGVRRRIFLPFDIEEREGNFIPVLYLTQPKLGTNNGPQYNRPSIIRMSPSSNRNLSVRHAEVNTPPLWDGGTDRKECSICLHTAGLFYKIHHCRNCGHYVCNNCSKKDWPATMLPRTYVPEKESIVRVCDNCSYLQEGLIDALRAGDLNRTMVFYLTGNVNLHCPMTIYKSEEFPIHTAIQGGNIHIVQWLIEDRRCSLSDADGEPLKTAEGLTPLAVAAFYGHREIMQYLVQRHGCRVTEIKDITILLRGLHASLEAPGELPEVEPQSTLGSLFGKRALPGELEPISTRSTVNNPPVPAQLATGNRSISQIPVTIAEAAPEYSVAEATSRPKLSAGKRRTIGQTSLAQTRRTLAESSRIMQTASSDTTHRRSLVVPDLQRAIPAPYTDDDVSVMTPDMADQFRGLPPRNSQHERSNGHRRSRSLHSATSTAIAVNSNMSPASSIDSLDRSPRSPSSETPRQISRYEVNSANLSRPTPDDDDESVDTLMTATQHTIDPVEANRMSLRATSQSYARLEAEEREAQRILSRAVTSSRQIR